MTAATLLRAVHSVQRGKALVKAAFRGCAAMLTLYLGAIGAVSGAMRGDR